MQKLELTEKQRDALRRLRGLLDDVDEQTHRPGELPLREAVARQARENARDLVPKTGPRRP